MAIQPHPLDNTWNKFKASVYYLAGLNRTFALEQELEQPGMTIQQQYYIRNLLNQYYTGMYLGTAGELYFILDLTKNFCLENQTVPYTCFVAATTFFFTYGAFLTGRNLLAMIPLKAQMAQRA